MRKPTTIPEFKSVQPASDSLYLPREKLVQSVARELEDGRSVRVVGADNTGKSSLLHLVVERLLKGDFVFRIRLSKENHLGSVDYHVGRSIEKSRKSLFKFLARRKIEYAREFEAPVSFENIELFAQRLYESHGIKTVGVVDNLYRYDLDWYSCNSLNEIAHLINSRNYINWLITDNERTATLKETIPDLSKVVVSNFTQDECRELLCLRRNALANQHGISELNDEIRKASELLFRATQGFPYQVVSIVNQLSFSLSSFVEEMRLAIHEYERRPDKTALKLLNYTSLEERVEDFIERLTRSETKETSIKLQDDAGVAAANYMKSTGAFQIKEHIDHITLKSSNRIILKHLKSHIQERNENSNVRTGVRFEEISQELKRKRSEGISLNVLLNEAEQHLIMNQTERGLDFYLTTLLDILFAERVMLFFPEQTPTKRIRYLTSKSRASSKELSRRVFDKLGWAQGFDVNSWLANLVAESRILRLPRPFNRLYTIDGEALSRVDVGETWLEHFEGADEVYFVPIENPNRSGDSGMMVVEHKSSTLHLDDRLSLGRSVRSMSNVLWTLYERFQLRHNTEQFQNGMKLVESCLMQSGSSQVYSLLGALQRFLKADYVDLCEVNPRNKRFVRLGKKAGDDINTIDFVNDFTCEFRVKPLSSETATRYTSNSREEGPFIPGSHHSDRQLFTCVAKECGGGATITQELLQAAEIGGIDLRVTQELERLIGRHFFSADQLESEVGKALSKVMLEEHTAQVVDLVMRHNRQQAVGVLTIGFKKFRMLSMAEFKIIDASSNLAANVINNLSDQQVFATATANANEAFATLSFHGGIKTYVRFLADYLETDYCSFSRVDKFGNVEPVFWTEGFGENYRRLLNTGEGNTGVVVESGRVIRQNFGPDGSAEKSYYYSPKHGYDEVEQTISEQLRQSIPVGLVRAGDIPVAFFGIPIAFGGRVVALIKFLQLSSKPLVTQSKLAAVMSSANAIAANVEFCDESNRTRSELAKAKKTFDEYKHDFQIPVTRIAHAAKSISAKVPESLGLKDFIEQTTRKITRNCEYLEDLFDYIDTAKDFNPVQEKIKLSEWLLDFWKLLDTEYPMVHFSLEQPDESIFIEFDDFSLSLILHNWINNAVEAGADSIGIEVKATGREVEVQVHNNGAQISDEVRRDMFKPYFSTKNGKRRGHGLANTRKHIRLNGGRRKPVISNKERTTLSFAMPKFEEN